MTQTVPARRLRSGAALLAVALMALVAAGCIMNPEARSLYDRTNALRASKGLPALAENHLLVTKAQRWAEHLASTGRLSHSKLSDGLEDLRWRALGENVAVHSPTADTLKTIHDRLAASPEHRANMLDRRFTHLGVGVARSPDGRVWVVQVFAAV